MTQLLRVLATLKEDQGSVPASDLQGCQVTDGVPTYIQALTHTHKIKNLKGRAVVAHAFGRSTRESGAGGSL